MADHRYYILVEWTKRSMANGSAESWDPDDGSSTFGDVRLTDSSIDDPQPEDVTHTACNTIAPEEWRSGILNAYDNVPFVEVYRVQTPYPEVGMVQHHNSGSWTDIRRGRVFVVALEEEGLQRITPSAPPA